MRYIGGRYRAKSKKRVGDFASLPRNCGFVLPSFDKEFMRYKQDTLDAYGTDRSTLLTSFLDGVVKSGNKSKLGPYCCQESVLLMVYNYILRS